MTDSRLIGWLSAVAVIGIAIVLTMAFASIARDCDANHGVVVQSVYGPVCVEIRP